MKYTQYINNGLPASDAGRLLLFPGRVIRGEGVIHAAGGFLEGAAVVAGPYVMRKFVRETLKPEGAFEIVFQGLPSPAEFYRITALLKEKGINKIVCFGGGKALDTCKFIKKQNSGLELTAVPTSAATCAAFTPVSVMYDKEGAYLNTVDSEPPDTVIIDYEIMRALPKVFFAAGAADTAAKFFEAAAQASLQSQRNVFDLQAESSSRVIFERLEALIVKAWRNLGNAETDEMTDINIILSGEISCIASESATAGIAHAVSHALTHIPAARKFLHGEHIGVSLLAQEAMRGCAENFGRIERLLEITELPLKLSDLGLKKEDISFLADKTSDICSSEKIEVSGGRDLLYNTFMHLI